MGYLRDFRVQLTEKLQGLDEKSREQVVDFVSSAVLESYRNGQKFRAEKATEKGEKHPEAKGKKRGA